MLAARFRSVYWVALASVAGLGCYMVTQRVAAERTSLEKLERDIWRTRMSIRNLETELGTRGSLSQMEKWNIEVLDLRAANSAQFVREGVQLASLNASPVPGAPATVAAVRPAGVVQAKAEVPRPAEPRVEQPMLRHANYVRPEGERITPLPQRVALSGAGPLDSSALADIGRIARVEAGEAREQ